MKRVVKKPEVRREEILFAAEKLFEQEGYTKTSVEAIIKEAGIAKGTFYYYFKAKQDIVCALVELIVKDVEAYFKSIVEQENVPAIEKLQLMIRGPKKQSKIKPFIMDIIHKPENREIQEKLNVQNIELIAPLMTKIFEQGNKEGIFKKSLSLECVQLILGGSQFVLDSGLFNWPLEKRAALLESAQFMLERVLEVKPGTLHFISDRGKK